VCPCALLCGATRARQNIGLADDGVIKNENKRGLRDTTVHVSDFGPHLEQGLPGMIDFAVCSKFFGVLYSLEYSRVQW
jgi:hypothetical protein